MSEGLPCCFGVWRLYEKQEIPAGGVGWSLRMHGIGLPAGSQYESWIVRKNLPREIGYSDVEYENEGDDGDDDDDDDDDEVW